MGTACFLERRLMAVYLIQAGGLPIVKIGHAIDVAERISQHQCSHWEDLKLIRQWEGGVLEEGRLHDRFRALHIRGEWFSLSADMFGDVGLKVIEAVSVAPKRPMRVMARVTQERRAPAPDEQAVIEAIERHCLLTGETPTNFGRRVGSDGNLVGDMRAGRSPSLRMMRRIEAALCPTTLTPASAA